MSSGPERPAKNINISAKWSTLPTRRQVRKMRKKRVLWSSLRWSTDHLRTRRCVFCNSYTLSSRRCVKDPPSHRTDLTVYLQFSFLQVPENRFELSMWIMALPMEMQQEQLQQQQPQLQQQQPQQQQPQSYSSSPSNLSNSISQSQPSTTTALCSYPPFQIFFQPTPDLALLLNNKMWKEKILFM